mgnify:FL=1
MNAEGKVESIDLRHFIEAELLRVFGLSLWYDEQVPPHMFFTFIYADERTNERTNVLVAFAATTWHSYLNCEVVFVTLTDDKAKEEYYTVQSSMKGVLAESKHVSLTSYLI